MSDSPKRPRQAADDGSGAAAVYRAGSDLVKRKGGYVWCPTHQSEAVISLVERQGPRGGIQYVQWCSLVDLEDCGQECVCQLTGRAKDSR
jgi:hypothetical protein